jgi:hypothetical protein
MANFSVMNSTAIGAGTVQQAMAATYKTLALSACSSISTATGAGSFYRRQKLYDILVGTNGTPADNFMEYDVTRATITATAAAFTAFISSLSSNWTLDPADASIVAGVAINSTAEGGITATTEAWYVGVNQRASYRWVAAPGSEIVLPATSSNALCLRARSGAYTGTATANTLINEQ